VSDWKSEKLEEIVASEAAQLLIDADDARQIAATLKDRCGGEPSQPRLYSAGKRQ
jgi:hypothetical protein